MKYGFGIDLGGTTVKIAYFDQLGTMLDKWEIPTVTDGGGAQILPDIGASIRGYLEQKKIADEDILGLGIGVPGPVNSKGVVNKCINLGWGVFNIAQALSELTGFPVKAGNDANVAALGEYWKGGGQGCENMVFVTLGTGVGGGIVVEGRLLHGAHGSGSEIGHLVLERSETEPCNCGKRGCVEQYCSATGVVRLAKRYLAQHDTPSSLRSLSAMTCKDVFDAGKAGGRGGAGDFGPVLPLHGRIPGQRLLHGGPGGGGHRRRCQQGWVCAPRGRAALFPPGGVPRRQRGALRPGLSWQ